MTATMSYFVLFIQYLPPAAWRTFSAVRFVALVPLVLVVTAGLRRVRPAILKLRLSDLLVAWFGSVAVLSTLWSSQPVYSLARAGSFTLLLVACFCLSGRLLAISPGLLLDLLAALHVVVIGSSLLAAVGVLPGGTIAGLLRGPIGNPNDLAGVLLFTFPAAYRQWRESTGSNSKNILWRRLLLASLWLAPAVLVMTRSRAGIIAFVAGVVFLFGGRVVRRPVTLSLVPLAAGIVLLALPSHELRGLGQSFVYKGQEGDMLYSRRRQLSATLEMARRRPLLGWGFGVSAGVHRRAQWNFQFFTPAGFGREKTNAYLGLVEELGIAGSVPLWGLVTLVFVRAYRRARAGGFAEPTSVVTLAIIVAAVVHVNGEAWLTSSGNVLAFWFWSLAGGVVALGGERGWVSRRVRRPPLGRAFGWNGTWGGLV